MLGPVHRLHFQQNIRRMHYHETIWKGNKDKKRRAGYNYEENDARVNMVNSCNNVCPCSPCLPFGRYINKHESSDQLDSINNVSTN